MKQKPRFQISRQTGRTRVVGNRGQTRVVRAPDAWIATDTKHWHSTEHASKAKAIAYAEEFGEGYELVS